LGKLLIGTVRRERRDGVVGRAEEGGAGTGTAAGRGVEGKGATAFGAGDRPTPKKISAFRKLTSIRQSNSNSMAVEVVSKFFFMALCYTGTSRLKTVARRLLRGDRL